MWVHTIDEELISTHTGGDPFGGFRCVVDRKIELFFELDALIQMGAMGGTKEKKDERFEERESFLFCSFV